MATTPSQRNLGGRPPTPVEDRYTERVVTRLKPAERKAFDDLLDELGLTEAEYVRGLLEPRIRERLVPAA